MSSMRSGFVEHHRATACTFKLRRADDPTAARAYRPPGRRFFERARLLPHLWPPVKPAPRARQVATELAQLARDLSTNSRVGQITRPCSSLLTQIELLQERQRKGGGLAAAGLRLTIQVFAAKQSGMLCA